ncbi:Rrna processing protein rrp7, partial [Globisporangium splendens]
MRKAIFDGDHRQKMAQVVGGYHAIALPLAHSAFKRYIYVKKHNVKENEALGGESQLAADRTVYVVNLPAHADEDWLRACLEPAVGSIQHVVNAKTADSSTSSSDGNGSAQDPLMAKTAHVVFKSKDAVKKVLRVKELDTGDNEAPVAGLQAYLNKYKANKPGLAAVKAIADKYMAKFDADEEEDFRKREELKAQVDDDGFKTVVNTKKRTQAAAEDLGRPAKKQKSKEMDNFYRFQMRERKRDQLKSLRERFEEDRQMVEKLKQANKFKPE